MADETKALGSGIVGTDVQRIIRLNRWYDSLPTDVRFHIVMWVILLIGAINFAMTAAVHFPFGLLLLLGFLAVAGIRVPYVLGYFGPVPAAHAVAPKPIRITGVDWAIDLNERYEAWPEIDRMWMVPAVLLTAGTINMWLTISARFPFGLLFLLVLLALVAIRAPYVAGWFVSSPNRVSKVAAPAASEPVPAASMAGPVSAADPAPVVQSVSEPVAEPVSPPVTSPFVAPAEAKSVEDKSVEAAPVEAAPVEDKPVEAAPVEAPPPVSGRAARRASKRAAEDMSPASEPSPE